MRYPKFLEKGGTIGFVAPSFGYAPDRIIIEPSGVGKLSDVIKAVKDVAEEVEVQLDRSDGSSLYPKLFSQIPFRWEFFSFFQFIFHKVKF